jgi:hypothetical protein
VPRTTNKTGLTDALSSALVRRDFHPVHDRGGVLVSAACAVLLGARSIAGIDVMRHAALVLRHSPSASTLYRTLDQVGPVQLAKIASARARVRSRVHDLLDLRPGGFPWIRVDGRPLTGWTVLVVDASFVPAHSDKEGAEPYRKGSGLHYVRDELGRGPAEISPALGTHGGGSMFVTLLMPRLRDRVCDHTLTTPPRACPPRRRPHGRWCACSTPTTTAATRTRTARGPSRSGTSTGSSPARAGRWSTMPWAPGSS